MASETDRAYLAGFFDGEGWVCITRTKKTGYITLHVGVCNTHLNTLLRIQRVWGGNIVKQTRYKLSWKQAYNLRWFGKEGVSVLKQLMPYLNTKKEQAKLGVQFPTTTSGTLLSQENQVLRLLLRGELLHLNK